MRGTTDIIVYGQGANWRLQGQTEEGLFWLQRNAGLPQSHFCVTFARDEAGQLCHDAERCGLLLGAASFY